MSLAVPKLAIVIFMVRVVGPTKGYEIGALYFSVVTLIMFSALNIILGCA